MRSSVDSSQELQSRSQRQQFSPKPSWIKAVIPSGENHLKIKHMVSQLKLTTVCQEARCPNLGECWGGGTATFMLLGDTCTRGCRFCYVKTGNPKKIVDHEEPAKVVEAIKVLGLSYVVITSVNRDDLEDQGASHFVKVIENIRSRLPQIYVEVLTPDFRGERKYIEQVSCAKPHVFAHNIETVERLTPRVRDPRAKYLQSLKVLEEAKKHELVTKSSIMLGLGETDGEIRQTLSDLRDVNCDAVTFGQYLRPSKRHLPVEKFVTPEEFLNWKQEAEKIGFLYVASGPLVRSSYRAGEYFLKSLSMTRLNLENNS